jgi:hypothetical protein
VSSATHCCHDILLHLRPKVMESTDFRLKPLNFLPLKWFFPGIWSQQWTLLLIPFSVLLENFCKLFFVQQLSYCQWNGHYNKNYTCITLLSIK